MANFEDEVELTEMLYEEIKDNFSPKHQRMLEDSLYCGESEDVLRIMKNVISDWNLQVNPKFSELLK